MFFRGFLRSGRAWRQIDQMNESNRKAGRQVPWEGSGEREPGEFGLWLRREREVREVTLAEIADVTKISKTYLQALEEERFDVLPAPVFAKGFLREYARYVGLDPDEVVNSYLSALREEEPEVGGAQGQPSGRSSFDWMIGVVLAAALLILVAVIGFAGFWAERSQRGSAATSDVSTDPASPPLVVAPPVSATPQPVATDPSAQGPASPLPAETPPSPLVVTIDFTEDCWVEASVDGRRRLSELHVQGESLQIDAERRVELTLGNPSGVVVEVNGEPYSLADYRPGRVARDIVIELGEGG
jgi:cytoskeletal protein RodZ